MTASTTEPSRGYRTCSVVLLVLVYFVYMVDRQAIVISQELIKHEFGISDTAMGLVTGTIYGIAYALAGLPLGWAADRVNRRNLLAALVGLWSALTAICGLSTSYVQLAIARLGIGAAEAGAAPAALSILCDMFPPERRATISSIFFAGSGLGAIASFMAGGYIATHYGWRAVFILYGLPGILLALLIFFVIKEPARNRPAASEAAPRVHLLRGIADTLRSPGLGPLYVATAFSTLSVTGIWTWMVPFFMRSYKLDLATTGLILALGTGLFSTIGMVTTSMLSDRLRRRSAKGPLRVVITGSLLHLVIGLLVLSCNNLVLSVIGLCAMGAVMLVNVGPTNAMISEIAPPYARGVGFALFTFVSNVVGAGLGPLTVGLLSDQLGGDPAALREAMMIVLLSQGISILAYWRANRRLSGMLPADRIVRPSDMEAQS